MFKHTKELKTKKKKKRFKKKTKKFFAYQTKSFSPQNLVVVVMLCFLR